MEINWREEVGKFREWAANQAGLYGEWESYYEAWPAIYQGVEQFFDASVLKKWTPQETEDLLYILARDNECEVIADELKEKAPEITFHLASESLQSSDWDARWQLAHVLGFLCFDSQIEPLLLRFADDGNEYVRRRALQSLARVASPHTEMLALREWNRKSENQQWARMMALSCWHHIGSPLLEAHLQEAEVSPFAHLSYLARNLRNGELEPWQQLLG